MRTQAQINKVIKTRVKDDKFRERIKAICDSFRKQGHEKWLVEILCYECSLWHIENVIKWYEDYIKHPKKMKND